MAAQEPRIAIITTCHEDWGGSEELWAAGIPHLAAAGYQVTVLKRNLNKQHARYQQLVRDGVQLRELSLKAAVERRLAHRRGLRNFTSLIVFTLTLFQKTYRKAAAWGQRTASPFDESPWPGIILRRLQPRLVIISQGINFDGLALAHTCKQLCIPYAIVAQKAVDFYWPQPAQRQAMRDAYLRAAHTYFVSAHNLRLTEEQFGVRLPHTAVLYNPVKVPRAQLPFPDTAAGWRLACVGRYFLLDKGQDILIRIMSQPKWKARPITISFVGAGADKDALMDMAALLGADNIRFENAVADITQVWLQHHALVLPARSEGLPLVLLEAMACGRTVIVSTAGGNADVVSDGVNGFIAPANEAAFDAAMERAWEARNRWHALGREGLAFVTAKVPPQPEKVFADALLQLINTLD